MKFSLIALVAAAATAVSAGIVITPVFENQVVAKDKGDCFFGVNTPKGCAPLRKTKAKAS